ncbi:MAG: monovalent cation/H+ antiporter complex subunit F [Acidimicrobiia bacterium]
MSVVNVMTVVVLLAAAGTFAVRLYVGPSISDRVNALNGVIAVGMASIALHARVTGVGSFLPALVVLALVGFIGSAVIARYLEERAR